MESQIRIRIKAISEQIHGCFPEMRSIGCFARVTDVTLKTEAELEALHRAGYDGLTIGIETADDEALPVSVLDFFI